MKGIMGRKIGMTQVFTTDGTLIPVTVVEVQTNVVTQKKTLENDGYTAIQLGMEDVKESRATIMASICKLLFILVAILKTLLHL